MSSPRPIVIYGAGGLGREVAWIIHRINQENQSWRFEGFIVSDTIHVSPNDSSDQIIGDEAWLAEHADVAVALAVGNSAARLRIARRLRDSLGPERFPSLVDPTLVYDPATCQISPGVVIAPSCVLSVNVRLDPFAYLNPLCAIGHEATIGDASILNWSVNVSGGVRIGEGVMIGSCGLILQYLTVGDHAVVGAGAVVTKDVGEDSMVVGVPARVRTP